MRQRGGGGATWVDIGLVDGHEGGQHDEDEGQRHDQDDHDATGARLLLLGLGRDHVARLSVVVIL